MSYACNLAVIRVNNEQVSPVGDDGTWISVSSISHRHAIF